MALWFIITFVGPVSLDNSLCNKCCVFPLQVQSEKHRYEGRNEANEIMSKRISKYIYYYFFKIQYFYLERVSVDVYIHAALPQKKKKKYYL